MVITVDTSRIATGVRRWLRAVIPGTCGGYWDGAQMHGCGDVADYGRGFCRRCIVEQKAAMMRLTKPMAPFTVTSGVQQIHEKITIDPDPALLSRAAISAAPHRRTQRGGGQ